MAEAFAAEVSGSIGPAGGGGEAIHNNRSAANFGDRRWIPLLAFSPFFPKKQYLCLAKLCLMLDRIFKGTPKLDRSAAVARPPRTLTFEMGVIWRIRLRPICLFPLFDPGFRPPFSRRTQMGGLL